MNGDSSFQSKSDPGVKSVEKSALVSIFITVFIYLVGFGVVIPLIPLLGRKFGATALEVGLLMSIYSLMQFLFSPFWGRLSDRYGRRSILLFCLMGEAFAYLLFATVKGLPELFVARALAGFFGASLSTASAYVSDVTPPQERSKGMALIGAAFGLGFLFGPAIGGGLAYLGETYGANPSAALIWPAAFVAGLCLFNFVLAYFRLPESLSVEKRQMAIERRRQTKSRWSLWVQQIFGGGVVGRLMLSFFAASIAMSIMEATLILLVGDRFSWGIKEVSWGFAYIGLISVFMQGFLVRKILPLFGERLLLKIGLSLMAISFLGIAWANSIAFLAVLMTLLAVGQSLTNPSLLGSISLLTKGDEQGEILGSTQGLASLGRIIGPAFGGWLYGQVSMDMPFLFSGGVAAAGLFIIFQLGSKVPATAKKPAIDESLALPIGDFQFENLLSNRVPFVLLNQGVDISTWPNVVDRRHLENVNRVFQTEKEAQKILEQVPAQTQAVVIMCKDGVESKKMAAKFSALRPELNLFYVLGGYEDLLRGQGRDS